MTLTQGNWITPDRVQCQNYLTRLSSCDVKDSASDALLFQTGYPASHENEEPQGGPGQIHGVCLTYPAA